MTRWLCAAWSHNATDELGMRVDCISPILIKFNCDTLDSVGISDIRKYFTFTCPHCGVLQEDAKRDCIWDYEFTDENETLSLSKTRQFQVKDFFDITREYLLYYRKSLRHTIESHARQMVEWDTIVLKIGFAYPGEK